MIERQTINGREATVAYFDEQTNPVDDLSLPHYAKVLFDDGEMILLHSGGTPPMTAQPFEPDTSDEHEHDAEPFDRHRARFAPRRLKIYGQSLASWAKRIIDQDYARIESALKLGLSAGDDNTDIAHRVIGSRRLNGVNGATEITRQHILRLGRGLLRRRKSRMSETTPDVRRGK